MHAAAPADAPCVRVWHAASQLLSADGSLGVVRVNRRYGLRSINGAVTVRLLRPLRRALRLTLGMVVQFGDLRIRLVAKLPPCWSLRLALVATCQCGMRTRLGTVISNRVRALACAITSLMRWVFT
jgi:hypothetical protein